MPLRVATANILSPHTHRLRMQTPPQYERIPQIAQDIQILDPDVLVICEIQTSSAEDYLAKLTSETGLEVRIQAEQKAADEGIAILTKPDIDMSNVTFFEIVPGSATIAADGTVTNTFTVPFQSGVTPTITVTPTASPGGTNYFVTTADNTMFKMTGPIGVVFNWSASNGDH